MEAEVEAEAEAVMKKLMEAEAEAIKNATSRHSGTNYSVRILIVDWPWASDFQGDLGDPRVGAPGAVKTAPMDQIHICK